MKVMLNNHMLVVGEIPNVGILAVEWILDSWAEVADFLQQDNQVVDKLAVSYNRLVLQILAPGVAHHKVGWQMVQLEVQVHTGEVHIQRGNQDT